MRLVTWNVAGRVTRHPEQARVVAALGADVVALQEVTARTLPLWREALAEAGLVACVRSKLIGVGVAHIGRPNGAMRRWAERTHPPRRCQEPRSASSRLHLHHAVAPPGRPGGAALAA